MRVKDAIGNYQIVLNELSEVADELQNQLDKKYPVGSWVSYHGKTLKIDDSFVLTDTAVVFRWTQDGVSGTTPVPFDDIDNLKPAK